MIDVKNLSKTFDKKVHAVKDVSFHVDKGEVISLIGPSGSGKSTVLRCINGLETPDEGTVLINGKALDFSNPKQAQKDRTVMGFVFQHFNLFANMTVLQNLTLAPINVLGKSQQEAEATALKYLERVGLLDKKDSYPSKLSGGQQQRVAIARALCMEPQIMLFDEPTSALDPEMIKEVLNVIRDLVNDGMTMIIVTHEMNFAREVSNRIAFLEDGTIVEMGTPEYIFTQSQNQRIQEFLEKVL
ncbi:MAG: amino acid ABC transporter ATP-binding protein [Erysipelotrichaceae bacterium]|nr:amino acid ABC transporter ATP-binding protein [Erysipelotrichaceae bacterium]MBR3351136.1 amino acid ABC transporter ATP-binding protein [Erysipelotrichaceae bacterium]